MPSRIALALLPLLLGCGTPAGRGATGLKVGAARVDITPAEPIRLSGYAARTASSEGVEDPLFARAVAFEDVEGTRAVVLSLDAIAITTALSEEIARRIEAAAGVPSERVAVATSHSHTAPALAGVIPNLLALTDEERKVIERYTRLFVEKSAQAGIAAVRNLAPAELRLRFTAAAFGANRRTPGGPVDPEAPVLWATGSDGRPRAVLFGYACHCTTLQFNRVTGDWAGYAQAAIEKALPGTVAACLIGCGADTNPSPRGRLEMAREHGQSLASAILYPANVVARPIRGPLAARKASVQLPFDKLPTQEELRQKIAKGPPQEKRLGQMLLDRWPLAPSIPYPIQTLSFGEDLSLVFLGGEVVVDYALRLKREYLSDRVWPVAYANDVPGYIPSERILAEGGYEGGGAMVWYGQPARFAQGVEEIIHARIRELLPPAIRRSAPAEAVKSPAGPEESLRHFVVEPGFEVDLVAAEPHVLDPIHLAWDARGRMYVTEMIDYPEGPPAGRIVRLEDADGDGRMDRSTVFAQGLAFPTSAMPWRQGILVTCDPELFYLEDRDGDGRADAKRVLFTGFAQGNTQHRVNSLQWGLDNWVYGGNGDSTAAIQAGDRPAVQMTFADFRFRPDTLEFEVLAEHSGYALTFDDAGRRFVSQSGGNMRHVVLERRWRDRNPFPPSITNAQALETRAKLHPVSGSVERFNDPLHFGFFTAASGLTVYRGGNFPEHYRGNLFIGESAGNLVHRDVPVPQGASFRNAPHTQPQEFLASRDPWFRPVFLTTGPDGCLYVADMYRAVIEHPEWIPEDIEKTLNLKAGNDKGRVYRVRHRAFAPRRLENLEALGGDELVKRLASPNGWVRDTVQRLLVERQERGVKGQLEALATGTGPWTARIHALGALQGLGVLDPALVRGRLADPDPRVREHAVRLSERIEVEALLPLARDADLGVRLQAAARLGEASSKEAVEALGDVVFEPANDTWVRYAAILSRPDVAHRVLERVGERIGKAPGDSGRMLPFVWRLASVVGHRNDAAQLREALGRLLPAAGGAMTEWQMIAFGGGIVPGVAQRRGEPGKRLREIASGIEAGEPRLSRAVAEAARIAEDSKVIDGTRYDALLVLGADPDRRHVEILKKYLSPKHAPELQDGAILGVSYLDAGEEAARLLLEHWGGYAPPQKQGVLDGIFRRADRIPALLGSIEGRKVAVAELGDGRREQLRRLSDEALRKRAVALLEADPRAERKRVLEARRGALALKGRRAPGQELFAKHCASCHPNQGVGPNVGPDVVRVRKREKEGLFVDILDPNAAVAPNYVSYNIVTTDEVIYNGIVVSQSPAGVTLRMQNGIERTVPRAQIEQLQSTGKSLMPEMFETVLNDQELADLIEFLRQVQ